MPPTKTFPKYWVVDIGENAEHKLLPKFKKWFCETSKINYWHFLSKFYGYTGDGYEGHSFLYVTNPNIITLEQWHDHFFPNEKVAITFNNMKLKTTRADGTEVELELTPEQEKAMEVKKSTKRWRANKGCEYCYADSYGVIEYETENHHTEDDFKYNIGNYYQTKEQAEFAQEKQLAIVKINDRIAELNKEFTNNEWHIIYRYNGNITTSMCFGDYNNGYILIGISSQEVANQIIEEFRDDLLKFIFN